LPRQLDAFKHHDLAVHGHLSISNRRAPRTHLTFDRENLYSSRSEINIRVVKPILNHGAFG
jgi:hypothetical protein